MTGEALAPAGSRVVEVALESRARRWPVDDRAPALRLGEPATVPVGAADDGADLLRVSYGAVLRVAVLAGAEPGVEPALRRTALASGAALVAVLRTNDPRSLVERAIALREARPDLVLVLVADRREAGPLVDLVEALRLGCAGRTPAPRVIVAGEAHAALRLKAAAAGLAVEILPDPRRPDGTAAFAHRAREIRRGTASGLILRDEALEELARLVAARGEDTLLVDASGGSTSLVHARADGTLRAAHVAPLGCGSAADRTAGRSGLDGVRRWIPWASDGPSLLERVFNRARWPDALPAETTALALEIALAHEALQHALADATAAGLGEVLREAPRTLVTGAAADLARPAHTALVALDGLAPIRPTTLHRDSGDALVALGALAAAARAAGTDPTAGLADELERRLVPLALVVPVRPGRRSTVRVNGALRDDEDCVPGAFFSLPYRGPVQVEIRGTPVQARGSAGELGVIVDARPRPLTLPPRDAERIPTLVRWFAALDPGTAGTDR